MAWCPSTILAGHECERTHLSSIHLRTRARHFRARLQGRDLCIRGATNSIVISIVTCGKSRTLLLR